MKCRDEGRKANTLEGGNRRREGGRGGRRGKLHGNAHIDIGKVSKPHFFLLLFISLVISGVFMLILYVEIELFIFVCSTVVHLKK